MVDQVAFTQKYIDQSSDRQRLADEIKKNWDYAKVRYSTHTTREYMLRRRVST